MNNQYTLAQRLVRAAIQLYQRTLSPDHGYGRALAPRAGCRFYPSCSQYTYEAVGQFGVWRGVTRGMGRLARCHPWSAGGFDPVTR